MKVKFLFGTDFATAKEVAFGDLPCLPSKGDWFHLHVTGAPEINLHVPVLEVHHRYVDGVFDAHILLSEWKPDLG